MRRLLRDLRARIERRAHAWIRRRQGADTDPVELRRQRIYILPTRLGVAYGAMLCAMLLGGMNYNNNLGLGFTFLLVSLGLVTMRERAEIMGAALTIRSRPRRGTEVRVVLPLAATRTMTAATSR